MVRFIRQDLIDDQDFDSLSKVDVAFVGKSDLDDRSAYSVARTSALGSRKFIVRYDPSTYFLEVGDKSYRADNAGLEDLALNYKANSIAIDATTLDFAEIALLLYAYTFPIEKPRIGFLYVEPEEYVRRTIDDPSVNGIAFDLTDNFSVQAIPPFSPMLNNQDSAHLVAFLGFEGGRLLRVLNQDDGQYIRKTSVIFGIPPFQTSWDLEAFMANSRLLSNRELTVKFCGANNPKAAYEILIKTSKAINDYSECNRLIVSPFGTKPMAIGAALYCAIKRQPRVIFDHPQRKQGRTRGVHCTHWYEVELN